MIEWERDHIYLYRLFIRSSAVKALFFYMGEIIWIEFSHLFKKFKKILESIWNTKKFDVMIVTEDTSASYCTLEIHQILPKIKQGIFPRLAVERVFFTAVFFNKQQNQTSLG